MEEIFITKIDIEKSRNLENVTINLSETERKHLILTGRNGSGKTSLLRELDYAVSFRRDDSKVLNKTHLTYTNNLFKIGFNPNLFFTVFFEAQKTPDIRTPNKIEKLDSGQRPSVFTSTPLLNKNFLQFLVNQKADRSFAKDDGEIETVQQIDNWFEKLEKQLKIIFETNELQLLFKRRDYTFDIIVPDREPFGFETLSDGYSSIIGIIAELIMRMERVKIYSNIYDLQGVVLIDEIETHLHVSLQKIILPFLTELFPKIQFIVSTHSPFILSSVSNAVVFDLENETVIEDLSQYSYDAIIESYFDTDKYSEEMKEKMEAYDKLSLIEDKNPAQIHQFKQLKSYFDEAPKYMAPELKAKLLEIELRSIKPKTAVD